MSIFFEEEGAGTLGVWCQELAAKVVQEAIEYVDFPYESEVSILLTDNEAIQAINKEFREIDRPTDVLSFPMIAYETPGVFDFLEADDSCFHPESGEAILGDIVVSKEKVLEQAEEYGHSIEREFAFLIAHSMLHLFGFDHMEAVEQKEMEVKQEEILSGLGITR